MSSPASALRSRINSILGLSSPSERTASSPGQAGGEKFISTVSEVLREIRELSEERARLRNLLESSSRTGGAWAAVALEIEVKLDAVERYRTELVEGLRAREVSDRHIQRALNPLQPAPRRVRGRQGEVIPSVATSLPHV